MKKTNILEKIISYLSPTWAYNRQAYRRELDDTEQDSRNYDAGKYDRLNSGWSPIYNQSAEFTDKQHRDIIRARSRDLERNSDIFNGIISSYVRNIIGYGLNLQVKTENSKLNDEIKALWDEWVKPRNCDVTGESTFLELIEMIIERYLVDGGILIYKTYTKDGIVPFKLQLIEVDELDTTCASPKYKSNVVVGGVEKNRYNKPIGYWLKKYNPDGTQGHNSEFIKKDDVIFFYKKSRPSQTREMSQMAPTISRIRDITSFMETQSLKERIIASLAVFVRKINKSVDGIGRSSKVGQEEKHKDISSGYDGTTITPGMITELKPGEDISVVNPSSQGNDATEFIRMQQRMAGAGQGLSYETTTRDMSQVNYSSARQGLIEDEATFGLIQTKLIECVLREIYEAFLISLVLDEKVNIPDFWNNKHKYLHHIWKPGARKWIDPLKEATANATALKTGQKTFQQICNEQGTDWKETIDDMAEAQNYAEEKGVKIFEKLFAYTGQDKEK